MELHSTVNVPTQNMEHHLPGGNYLRLLGTGVAQKPDSFSYLQYNHGFTRDNFFSTNHFFYEVFMWHQMNFLNSPSDTVSKCTFKLNC